MLDLHRLVKNLSIDKMQCAGTKHTGVPVKTLKKLLKKAGLKVSGKKTTLTRRANKARLLGGGPGGIGAIKGLPAAVLTPEQQKAKDANDKYQAELEQSRKINQETKDSIDAYNKSLVTTTYEPRPSFGKFLSQGISAFRGGAKKKTRRA
jgi:hypothetical protein